MPSFRYTSIDDPATSRFQDNVSDALDPLLKNPESYGTVLENVELLTGQPNVIAHKLGRKLIGWKVWDLDTPAIVYRQPDKTPTLTLTLNTTANCTATIKVF